MTRELQRINIPAALAEIEQQIKMYRRNDTIAKAVLAFVTHKWPKRPDRRTAQALHDHLTTTDIPIERVRYEKSSGFNGAVMYELEVVFSSSDTSRFSAVFRDGKPDLDHLMRGYDMLEHFANTLERKLPEFVEKASQFNAHFDELVELAKFCEDGTIYPAYPLTKFFQYYELDRPSTQNS